MIEWKKFNHVTAGDEIEENELIILQRSGRISHVTHDAMERNFYYNSGEDEITIISYQYVTHYAEINLP